MRNMKKLFIIGIAIAISSLCHAQKVEFEEAQTRIIEPIQEVLVRPMSAEMKMLSNEMKVYMPSWQIKEKKINELTQIDLDNARANAAFHAAILDGADAIVAATFYVRNHIDEKGKPTDHGIDIIVRGYPVKYVNWHLLGDPKYNDEKWEGALIESYKARALNKDDAAAAAKDRTRSSVSSK